MGQGIRLRELRVSRFLTQQQLADRSGVTRVSIARIENGATVPLFTTIRKLAGALEVDLRELVPEPAELVRNRGVIRRRRELPGDLATEPGAPPGR